MSRLVLSSYTPYFSTCTPYIDFYTLILNTLTKDTRDKYKGSLIGLYDIMKVMLRIRFMIISTYAQNSIVWYISIGVIYGY